MKEARMVVDRDYTVARTDEKLFAGSRDSMRRKRPSSSRILIQKPRTQRTIRTMSGLTPAAHPSRMACCVQGSNLFPGMSCALSRLKLSDIKNSADRGSICPSGNFSIHN